jgi:carbon monoxide dehydrogenase subunit G
MIRASGSVTVDRTAEQAFDFLADLENEPRWNPDASNVRRTWDGELGLGVGWIEQVKPLGTVVTNISEYERPTSLRFDAHNPKADIRVRFRFTPEGASTRIDAELELWLKGWRALFQPLVAPTLRRTYEHVRGPALKRAIEDAVPPAP